MLGADLHHPAVTAALSAAAEMLGMEVVYFGGISADEFSFARVVGDWPGLEEGAVIARTDSFCHRLLAGAPPSTADAAADPAYRDAPARDRFGIASYVGVPVHASDGRVVGTLCGVDHGNVDVTDGSLAVLRALAGVIEAHLGFESDRVLLRRTPAGWRVGHELEHNLTDAMVLADLLSPDLAAPARPQRGDDAGEETDQLRVAVTQLEHALAARVVIEQAIGVLAERLHVPPRTAFERLRKAARARGRKVQDLARTVIASSTDPTVPLPPELTSGRPAS
jgi:hypothetical protein